ncbi:MAG: patatin-like phospholipase family protein [Candidatus Competibacter sp.]|nr:patatin-like phospholipase family protein [Candidatus Competibacter sp.]MDS4069101.1 patatin-like phospholipase family protein [Candidatus Competibacter sp.]
MLVTQPESIQRQASGPRIGLAIAGGGPVGLVYEIGALRALDEALDGIDFNHLDAYVGVSAGAVTAALLANQIGTGQICHIFISNESEEHPLDPQIFLMPAFGEYWRRLASVPRLLWESFWRYLQNPLDLSLLQSLTRLGRALPSGFFDNEPIHEYLGRMWSAPGRTNDFRRLKNKLYVVAVDLDTGESVKFGAPGYDDVPISRAVQASSALPGLYPPVEIGGRYFVDGALLKTMHASVALQEGLDLLLCLNPLVPFDARLAALAGKPTQVGRLVEGGLPAVLSQTFRSLIHSRLRVGMQKYESEYEHSDVILFEPNRDDAKMFFTNVFSFSGRHWVCEHAYQTTRQDLLARREELEPILARHGIRMRLDVLEDRDRHYYTGLRDQRGLAAPAKFRGRLTRDLHAALDQLQDIVSAPAVVAPEERKAVAGRR